MRDDDLFGVGKRMGGRGVCFNEFYLINYKNIIHSFFSYFFFLEVGDASKKMKKRGGGERARFIPSN